MIQAHIETPIKAGRPVGRDLLLATLISLALSACGGGSGGSAGGGTSGGTSGSTTGAMSGGTTGGTTGSTTGGGTTGGTSGGSTGGTSGGTTGGGTSGGTTGGTVAAGPTVWVPDYGDQLLRVYVGSVASQPTPIVVSLTPGNGTACLPNSVAVNGTSVYVVCSNDGDGKSTDQVLVYSKTDITGATPGTMPITPKPTQVITDAANFNALIGIAFDSSGDMFVASQQANAVIEFTPAQLAKGGPGTQMLIDSPINPAGLAIDSSNNLWVTGLDVNGAPILLGFAQDAISANPSPTYCVTADTAKNVGSCDVDQNAVFNDFEGIAVFDGYVFVANNGNTSPGHYVYYWYPTGDETPIPAGGTGHLVDGPGVIGSNAAADTTAFQCPGGLFATATHLWVNDEGYNDPKQQCGGPNAQNQYDDLVFDGSGAGTVYYLNASEAIAENKVYPSDNTSYLTGRPGYGGIYVENDN